MPFQPSSSEYFLDCFAGKKGDKTEDAEPMDTTTNGAASQE